MIKEIIKDNRILKNQIAEMETDLAAVETIFGGPPYDHARTVQASSSN